MQRSTRVRREGTPVRLRTLAGITALVASMLITLSPPADASPASTVGPSAT